MNGYRLYAIMCFCIYTQSLCLTYIKCTVLFIAKTCADRDAQYYE